MLQGFDQCYISHDYREANKNIDWATNEAVQSGKMKIWYGKGELPLVTREILNNERYHGKQGRI